MNGFILSILFASILSACAKKEEIPIPKDQASPSQKANLNEIKTEIVKLFTQEGVRLDLNQVPIIVSTENLEGKAGLCVRDGDGAPVYMQLSPSLLISNRSEWGTSAVEQAGFVILLHEIGHCYFGREHDTARFSVEDHVMVFNEATSSGRVSLFLRQIPVTIMVADYDSVLPRSLKRYYVRELLGRDRISNFEDLLRYADVELAGIH